MHAGVSIRADLARARESLLSGVVDYTPSCPQLGFTTCFRTISRQSVITTCSGESVPRNDSAFLNGAVEEERSRENFHDGFGL